MGVESGGWNPHIKLILSEFLLSGQLQVDPVRKFLDNHSRNNCELAALRRLYGVFVLPHVIFLLFASPGFLLLLKPHNSFDTEPIAEPTSWVNACISQISCFTASCRQHLSRRCRVRSWPAV